LARPRRLAPASSTCIPRIESRIKVAAQPQALLQNCEQPTTLSTTVCAWRAGTSVTCRFSFIGRLL